MEKLVIPLVIIVIYSIKGIAVLAIAYLGARLAIRHERRTTKN